MTSYFHKGAQNFFEILSTLAPYSGSELIFLKTELKNLSLFKIIQNTAQQIYMSIYYFSKFVMTSRGSHGNYWLFS